RGRGNLLLNIGPRGDGSIPEPSVKIIEQVGAWLKRHGECIFDTDLFTMGLMSREGHESDFSSNGPYTRKGRALYQLVRYWPGNELVVAGFDTTVKKVTLLGVGDCAFEQCGEKVTVKGLPDAPPDPVCPVLRFDCAATPKLYLTAGMRVPKVPHPPYDPLPSDMLG
ncbi:MAG: alpha-L-fucosidase, partial [Kiritimatiellae bacterium]|nr:alpha-L-fucosidase [Kiritimatiellia bacterium]